MSQFSVMPVKRKKALGLGRRRVQGGRCSCTEGPHMHGGAWYNDLWNGIKGAAKPVHDFIKENKLVSKVLDKIPHPYAQAGKVFVDKLGYGKKKKINRGKRLGGGRKKAGHPGGAPLGSYDKHPRVIKQTTVAQGFLTMPMSLNGGVGVNTLGHRL
jgi:hypothetical protein